MGLVDGVSMLVLGGLCYGRFQVSVWCFSHHSYLPPSQNAVLLFFFYRAVRIVCDFFTSATAILRYCWTPWLW